ncbi:MAG: carboxypeptidase regulatory-like domain-containing protein [Bryobacterales bacterium]|nr:carboxypeptidase regulatory-like domain-containing protein [Bryobacterales bacterium]
MAALLLGAGTAAAATIEGRAADADGQVKGTVVMVFTRISGPAAMSARQTGSAAVAKDGRFQMDGLSEGTYAVCVEGVGHDYLNPCVWGLPTKAELATAEARQSVQVSLVSGVRLKIKYHDPKKLLAGKGNPEGKGYVQPGIWLKNGAYVELPETSRAADSKEHEIVAAPDEWLHVTFLPSGVRLLDAQGQEMPLGRIALSVPTSGKDKVKTLEFTVAEALP